MFKNVYIEKEVLASEQTKKILSKIKFEEKFEIDQIENVWGKTKKPYLQKRETLNLFIGNKRGQLVKEAPDAYGLGSEKHYYYIHAYNCIYECQYCYLQGYFNTPDIVFFVNHEQIINEIDKVAKKPGNEDAWFHAGEFSDSLNVSHITGELPLYFDYFKKNPKLKLELRTKSVNIRPLLALEAADNIIISFTLSSSEAGRAFDFKCPSVKARLIAIQKLVDHGYKIGLHLDPIIYHDDFLTGYKELIENFQNIIPKDQLKYISIGVVRFTKDVYREVQKNYPGELLTKQEYTKSFDGKMRYNHPMRMWILNSVKNLLIENDVSEQIIYMCMEESN